MTPRVPPAWRSVLPHLGYPLPADRTPDRTAQATTGIGVNLPLELVRQSISNTERWPIPEPVAQQYRRYRPTPLWRARQFEKAIDATVPVYVKYEGGNISGSHKLNTALAQAHYYRRAGVAELVTGTGAGQWGTALAAACAVLGLRCTVFMVAGSLRNKPYRGSLMRLLGATVHASPSELTGIGARGTGNGLSLAIGEAVEYAARTDGCAFAIGSGETYSLLHQSVIGLEAIEQLDGADSGADCGADCGADGGADGGLDGAADPVGVVVGCLGAGSNFGGIALPFFADAAAPGRDAPRLVAAESSACPKLTRGAYAYDFTDATGTGPMEAMYTVGSRLPIPESHSAGLRFHGAAKLISAMRHHGQIEAVAVGQRDALRAGALFTRTESVLPAPEAGHALAAAARLASRPDTQGAVLVCVSGHGLLDLAAYDRHEAGGEHPLGDDAPTAEQLRAAMAGLEHVAELGAGR